MNSLLKIIAFKYCFKILNSAQLIKIFFKESNSVIFCCYYIISYIYLNKVYVGLIRRNFFKNKLHSYKLLTQSSFAYHIGNLGSADSHKTFFLKCYNRFLKKRFNISDSLSKIIMFLFLYLIKFSVNYVSHETEYVRITIHY